MGTYQQQLRQYGDMDGRTIVIRVDALGISSNLDRC